MVTGADVKFLIFFNAVFGEGGVEEKTVKQKVEISFTCPSMLQSLKVYLLRALLTSNILGAE